MKCLIIFLVCYAIYLCHLYSHTLGFTDIFGYPKLKPYKNTSTLNWNQTGAVYVPQHLQEWFDELLDINLSQKATAIQGHSSKHWLYCYKETLTFHENIGVQVLAEQETTVKEKLKEINRILGMELI